jgi:hypothetical protein
MLEKIYDQIENRAEVVTVMAFLTKFAKDGDIEELFLTAVRDTRLAGFKEGVKAALTLQREMA